MSGLRERMNRLRGGNDSQLAAPELVGSEIAGEQQRTVVGSEQYEDEIGQDANMPRTSALKIDEPEEEILHMGWGPIGAKLHSNEKGSFLLRQAVYPAAHRHGLHRLDELREAASGLASFHGLPLQPEELLFLDLETTGLGVGAGNVPFMVGLAYASEDRFVVEQAVIRHPAEERAMLFYLEGLLPRFRYLVTYNGRTFDWPVMQNRFIMNGFGRRMWEPLHLDFLHPSRSIWRNTLASCKLSHVEEERLGIERVDDVPGSLAPQLYFRFLADGDPAPLSGVFRHNETDMLSLACLAIRFGHLLNDGAGDPGRSRLPLPSEAEEMVRTGLWLEKMGCAERAEHLYASATESENAAAQTLLMLAERDKKAGNWQRAVLLWQKAVQRPAKLGTGTAIAASVELAMYYEHKLKDYTLALRYASDALEMSLDSALFQRRDAKKRAEQDGLRKRRDRLRRKLGRMSNRDDEWEWNGE
ncbi:ribonuclease H-like domain-containing protein [Paenibacillus sp. NPDC058071]|uniref:ribonuclease H-like domain-containing protein n=1 Tax=Paenibacillus sp. NPDC058071 TaxID=3346326 RepID=UPI0036DAC1C9